ncbi:MAG: MBOAT family protein [Lachnospiraceae bacterium]|nr:MBOAT family protein [Lachnospiraceae bacterium]
MAYHTSIYLFLFLPVVLLLYQITPRKIRPFVLLAAGYVFFWIISGELVWYLILTTLFTHYIAIWIEGTEVKNKKGRKRILIFGILVLLGVLGYLKYYNFFAQNVNRVLDQVHPGVAITMKMIVLPIGISFYTLQAIGYMVDVYWKKIPAEKNLAKVALFLGFFPQIMEGPISMYPQTSQQLWKGDPITLENLTGGSLRIIWGLFKKMIIADRLYLVVQAVFEHYDKYNGVVIAAAAVAYTVQLYMEFSGCMDIVLGSGQILGVTLPENFRQPFASRNAAEFWRRWHITLGVWLKTYVFFPVSTSRIVKRWNHFGKTHLSKHMTKLGISAIALFPVWLGNGLWHGARWSYLFYGMYYFTILLLGIAVEPIRDQILKVCRINQDAVWWRMLQIGKTWMIIFTGELFFRANGLRAGYRMFRSIFENFTLDKLWDGTFLSFGLDKADYFIVFCGCLCVAIVGIIRERSLLDTQQMQKVCLPVRWAVYYGLIIAVILFGAYGVGYQQVDLIYAGF